MGASNCTGNGGSDCCTDTGYTKRICCEVQGKENTKRGIPRGIPQPPAGFSYHTKAKDSTTSQYPTGEWPHASSATSASNEKKNKLMAERILQTLAPERGPNNAFRNSTSDILSTKSGSSRQVLRQSCSGSFRNTPWKQEVPDPLPNWTQEDQQTLIEILEDYPRAGRDDSQLELALVKAMKTMPHRTGPDCHRCVKHIQGSRVAIFGK